MGILSRALRSGEGKKIKALESLIPDINALESEMTGLSDQQLQSKTGEFKPVSYTHLTLPTKA